MIIKIFLRKTKIKKSINSQKINKNYFQKNQNNIQEKKRKKCGKKRKEKLN
jgi:hypothetical protein